MDVQRNKNKCGEENKALYKDLKVFISLDPHQKLNQQKEKSFFVL